MPRDKRPLNQQPFPSALSAVRKVLETGSVGGGAPDNTVMPQSSKEVTPQSGNAAMPQSGNAAILQGGNAAIPQRSITALLQGDSETREKATFYLAPGQLEKLDDLAHAYRKRTGKRINRNDILRFLIEKAQLETLLAEW